MSARNAGVFRAYLEEQSRSTSVGVPSSVVLALRKKCEKQLNSFMARTTWIKQVKDAIRQQDSDIADVVPSWGGRGVKVQVDHHHRNPSAGRRNASGQGAQNCRKALREEVLLRGVEDLGHSQLPWSLWCARSCLCVVLVT